MQVNGLCGLKVEGSQVQILSFRRRVGRELRAGTVWTNTWAIVADQFEEGGFGQSGLGRLNGLRGLAEIAGVLKSYERSLNAGDAAGVVRLYTDDAVLLAPEAASAVGIDAVRAAYTGIFQAIDVDLTFEVAELKVLSPDWAFLRSTSNGVVTMREREAKRIRVGIIGANPDRGWAAQAHIPALKSLSDDFEITALSTSRRAIGLPPPPHPGKPGTHSDGC
jgi:uncharacterized protein (TIGR02246 family)